MMPTLIYAAGTAVLGHIVYRNCGGRGIGVWLASMSVGLLWPLALISCAYVTASHLIRGGQ
jgi:hypothetical protein